MSELRTDLYTLLLSSTLSFGCLTLNKRLIEVVNELKEAPYTGILPAPSGVPKPEEAIVLY